MIQSNFDLTTFFSEKISNFLKASPALEHGARETTLGQSESRSLTSPSAPPTFAQSADTEAKESLGPRPAEELCLPPAELHP